MTLNDRLFPITPHLQDALCELRARGVEYVWVDAICINQQDLDERSSQVSFMAQIFGNAAKVYAWLGTPTASFDLAYHALRNLRTHSPIIDDVDTVSALASIFELKYWQRIWVVQEISKAKEVEILWSGWMVP